MVWPSGRDGAPQIATQAAAAELGPRDEIGVHFGKQRYEHTGDTPQDVRIGKEAELIDVVIATRATRKDVLSPGQRAFDDDLFEPDQLGKRTSGLTGVT